MPFTEELFLDAEILVDGGADDTSLKNCVAANDYASEVQSCMSDANADSVPVVHIQTDENDETDR